MEPTPGQIDAALGFESERD
jgi:hypothetical protein